MTTTRTLGFSLSALLILTIPPARAVTTLPPDFDQEEIVSNLNRPTSFAYASDGRLFITEKEGRVRVVTAAGMLLSTPFATVSVNVQNDRGLLGIALHPDFPTQPYVYLAYTTDIVPPSPNNAFSRIHRVTRMTANGNVAVPGSEFVLIDNIPSDVDSHTGSALRFGPDGMLYASTGDGASYGTVDPLALRALNLDQLVGKVLRIHADGTAPVDNPFYTTPSANRSRVWQYGLRNPFKATFRPGTGKLYVNDVGWFSWEEANHAAAGASFGWPCWEGNDRHPLYNAVFPAACMTAPNTLPKYTYPHNDDGGAITGAAFFQGANYPAVYDGDYFVSDYSQRWIKYMELTPNDEFVSINDFASGDGAFRPVDLVLAPDGNLHYINIATDFAVPSGSIFRILYVGVGNHAPKPVASGTPASGYAPLDVSFSAEGTTDPDGDPLTYHWVFGDGAEADGFTTSHTYASNGVYLAVLQVNDTTVTREAKVAVTVGSLPPTATILTPPSYKTYADGETIAYSGEANDPDDGPLASDALRWTVVQHHETHEHAYQDSTGSSGSFVATGHGASGETVSYELVLTATDSSGLSDTRRIWIFENQPPFADAGGDPSVSCVLPAPTVILDGAASGDPDNQLITYAWTQTAGPPVALSDADAPTATFVAPAVAGGAVLTFQLEVADEHVSDVDTVDVAVPDLTDDDGDGFGSCGDCAPLDQGLSPPGETSGLEFAADEITMSWTVVSGATAYDLHRGTLAGLAGYDHACRLEALPGPTGVDADLPAEGAGFYYLSRAANACGSGYLGSDSAGARRPNPPCP